MRSDEERLVLLAQEGDRTAFRELVECHMKRVYYLSYDLTGNHEDAEDLSQEVFVKVFHSLNQFRADAKFSSWLHRITVNTFIDKRRKYSPITESIENEYGEDGERTNQPVDKTASNDPEARAEAGLMKVHIDTALEKLPSQQRAVFVLRHYHELALKEIAAILKISEGSVKSSLFRAIRRLQKTLHYYRHDLGLEESK